MITYFDSFITNCYVRIKIKIKDCYNEKIKINGLNRKQLEIITNCINNELEYVISNKKYINDMIIDIVNSINCNLDSLLKINKLSLFNKHDIINLIYEIIVWHYDVFILNDLDNKKIINNTFNIDTMRSTTIDKPLTNISIDLSEKKTDYAKNTSITNISTNFGKKGITYIKESHSIPNIASINIDERKVKINDNPNNFRSWLYGNP